MQANSIVLLTNVFSDDELEKEVVIANFATTSQLVAVADKILTVAIFATVQNKVSRAQIKSIISNDWLKQMINTQKMCVVGTIFQDFAVHRQRPRGDSPQYRPRPVGLEHTGG